MGVCDLETAGMPAGRPRFLGITLREGDNFEITSFSDLTLQ